MQTEKIQSYSLFVLIAGTAILTFFIFKPFLTPLALAGIFAVVLYPFHAHILRHMKGWKGLASLLTVVLATFLFLAPLALIGLLVIGEAQQTYVSLTQGAGLKNTQEAILYAGSSLEPYAPGATALAEDVANDLTAYATNFLSWMLGHAGAAFSSLLNIALDLFIFFIALFVFLRNGPAIRASLLHLSPFNDADDTRIFDRLGQTINSVVRGSLAVALVQGIVATVGYVLFGVPNAILWGVLTAMASLVPGVGTGLVMAPVIGYLFFTGEAVSALGLFIWGVVGVGLIDNFLGPLLMSRGIHLPSLVILLSVLGGLAFFGAAGIFLGPLTVSLLVVLFSLYADAQKKGGT